MDKVLLEKCVALRHELHENAELSGNEYKTMYILKKFIRDNTDLAVVDRGSYFYAVHKAGEGFLNIAFRCDIDALPIEETIELPYGSNHKGVSHKCGHDGHASVMAALAVEASEINNKNIYILFQPGEENGTGAKMIVEDGFLKNNEIDNIYAFHNIPGHKKGAVLLKDNNFACASKGMIINLFGKPSHAAYPELGINPSYGCAKILSYLRNIDKEEGYGGMVLCTIVGVDIGEAAFGTSAGSGRIMLTIRTEMEDDLNLLEKRIMDYSKCVCKNEGLLCSFEFVDEFPETRNNNEEIDKIKRICSDNKIDYEYLKEPMRWSEDFGYYLKDVQGAIIGIGDGADYPGLHTEGYDFPDGIIENAVDVFVKIAKC